MTKTAYHHGELPAVLMNLAIDAIQASGTETLSLRALARQAGVSPTAPYRHFDSKRCLFAAIATKGFEDLTERMRKAAESKQDLTERFIDMGVGYVEFAVENPVPYQLMFGSVLADFSDYEMLDEASSKSFAQLLRELEKLIEARSLTLSPEELGGVVWSGVHGMASLMINPLGRRVQTQTAQGSPAKAVASLHADTRRAMRVLFGNLVGDLAGTADQAT